ncbi:MAG: hypothetical protein MZV70_33635 [Desulfobacterales bacterium]|nr:hypothetical protein [Desulfobacterales bacterium]
MVFILVLNDGTFRYSLDDAYIHLSLSEGISRFHYGINPEVSSASSSMLLASSSCSRRSFPGA